MNPSAAQVNTDIVAGRKISAHKDADGQEAVIKVRELAEKVDHLVQLANAASDASTAYGEAVKAIAEKAGLQASVVRKFIAAKVSDNFDDKKRDCEQLQLCFDEIAA